MDSELLATLREVKRAVTRQILLPRTRQTTARDDDPSANILGVAIMRWSLGPGDNPTPGLRVLVRSTDRPWRVGLLDSPGVTIQLGPIEVQHVRQLDFMIRQGPATSGPEDPRVRTRPARPGSSIGLKGTSQAGTFGAVVMRGGSTFVLSAGHVLSQVGATVVQPADRDDSSSPNRELGVVSERHVGSAGVENQVDAGLASVASADVAPRMLIIGGPTAVADTTEDAPVRKVGRTTRDRLARVASVETDVIVEGAGGDALFVDQIMLEDAQSQVFAMDGDSGALAVDQTGTAIGLLIARSQGLTYATPLTRVLSTLNATLVPDTSQT